MGSIFGSDTEKVAPPDYSAMTPLTDKMNSQLFNDPNSYMHQDNARQSGFKFNAQQSLEKVLQGQSSTRGARSSQLASMANAALSGQQSQLAGQAAIADAIEREAAQNSLANIFMQQAAGRTAVDTTNAGIEQQNKSAQDRMIGMGLNAAGYALGGPAGGMAVSALTNGMGSSGSSPSNMGANPYSGAAAPSQSMQYNPSQYNMGQNLNFGGR